MSSAGKHICWRSTKIRSARPFVSSQGTSTTTPHSSLAAELAAGLEGLDVEGYSFKSSIRSSLLIAPSFSAPFRSFSAPLRVQLLHPFDSKLTSQRARVLHPFRGEWVDLVRALVRRDRLGGPLLKQYRWEVAWLAIRVKVDNGSNSGSVTWAPSCVSLGQAYPAGVEKLAAVILNRPL